MKVVYTLNARSDLRAISAYLRERNPLAANAVVRAIEQRIGRLADFPEAGPLTDDPPARELTIRAYPYKVYYEISGAYVWILHIRHTSRLPWRAGGR